MAGRMKGSFLSVLAAFALAILLNSSAFGVVTITENFTTDPSSRGWGGVDNQTADPPGAAIANDYGWKFTDDTGTAVPPPVGAATPEGEIGGVMNRAPTSFYGVNLGGAVDFNTTDMSVKGVLRQMNPKGSSTLNLGWNQGYNSVVANNANSLYVTWDDGAVGTTAGGGGTRARDGSANGMGTAANIPNLVDDAPTQAFTFDWNSTTNTFSFTLGSNPTSTHTLTEQQVTDLGDLTHWGLWGRTNPGTANADDAGNQLRIDDVTFTAAAAIVPEPASLGLLSVAGLALLRRRRHA
jgi:hypothetical protein